MMMRMKRKGFTLVEIMIVVAIIGLLAAIAIPNFVRARETAAKNACIANLKQIEGAIQVWAIDTNQTTSAVPVMGNLVPDYIKKTPACPKGGAYSMPANVESGVPTCNVSGHSL